MSQRDHALNKLRNILYFRLLHPWVKVGRNVHVQWSTRMWSPNRHVVIGDDVGIGPGCIIACDIEIGNKVLIAANVGFVGADDHRYDVVGRTMWDSGRVDARKTIIEDDVWIGFGAIIISGSRIRTGAIVGAGAVVAGEVPAYSIVVGPKANLLKMRFGPKELAQHRALLEDEERNCRTPKAGVLRKK